MRLSKSSNYSWIYPSRRRFLLDLLMDVGILRVEKHDDKLCFRNPGLLRLPIEQIFEGGVSYAHNPKIQNMLRVVGYGKNLGSGFPTIISAWKDAQWGEPDLKNKIEIDEVELVLPILNKRDRAMNDKVNDKVSDKVYDKVNDKVWTIFIIIALMQRMTDFCKTVSLSRPSGTLERRAFQDPTLRNLTVPCMGLLRFSIFDAVEKSVKYSIRANEKSDLSIELNSLC